MKLSLSVRVAERFDNKREVAIKLPEFVTIAQNAGYEALCMRASVVGTHSPLQDLLTARHRMDGAGLAVSMVTGDFAIPENNKKGPECLRNIMPYLTIAEILNCTLLRVALQSEEDIRYAQWAADEAREHNIRLVHQCHTQSPFETVEGILETVGKIGRTNFGITYEPANLALCGQDYGPETIRHLAPHIFNVYVQNHIPDPEGDRPMKTWTQDTVMSRLLPLDAPDGIDFAAVFAGLKEIGYDGYVTLHQAFIGDLAPQESATRSAQFLRGLIN